MMVFQNGTHYDSMYTRTEETVLAIILCVTICLSLYGNLGMLVVLYKNDKMWTSTNMLIGNLALSGLLVSLLCMPFSLSSVVNSQWNFKQGSVCKFNAFMTSELLLATILTHTMISVDKYFAVVKPFSRAMTVNRTWKIIFLVWFISGIMTIGPLFNVGKYAYNHTTLICGVGFPEKKRDSIYLLMLATIGFLVPNLVMGHVYLKVFLAVRQHTKRLQSTTTSSLDVLQLQKKLILTVFFSLLCFLVCWTPFCVFVLMAIFLDSAKDLPYGLGISAYWCGYIYNAINPLIICSMSARFGNGLYEMTLYLSRLPYNLFNACELICCWNRKTFNYSPSSASSGDIECNETPPLQTLYPHNSKPSEAGKVSTNASGDKLVNGTASIKSATSNNSANSIVNATNDNEATSRTEF